MQSVSDAVVEFEELDDEELVLVCGGGPGPLDTAWSLVGLSENISGVRISNG